MKKATLAAASAKRRNLLGGLEGRSLHGWTALAALPALLIGSQVLAGTELDVPDTTIDLATLGATSTSDLTFTNITYSNTAFTVSVSVPLGTLNDLDATQPLTISPSTVNTISALTLSGGANSVSSANGGDVADLLFVASGGSLAINAGAFATNGTLGVTLGTPGNLNIAGTGTATITSSVAMGANAIVKTGTGTLNLNAANTGTAGITIANGTLSTNNTTGLGSAIGTVPANSASNPVSIGLAGSSDNATLQLTGTPSLKALFTVATGAGTRTITSNNATVFPATGAVLDASSTILMKNSLTLSETSTGSMQIRGLISESGGPFGLILDAATTGYVQLSNTASTFTGGVAINGGSLSIAGSTSTPGGGPLQGPLGRGTVTLGAAASATTATLGFNGAFTTANALTVNAGGTRNLAVFGVNSNSAVYSGPIALNSDLTVTAPVTTTLASGTPRLRIDGVITGASNIIVQNGNTLTGAQIGSGSIRFGVGGTGNNSLWTGSLIVATGRAGLQTAASISANNIVGVASGAIFDFAEGAISPTIAGLRNATVAGALSGSTGGTVTATTATARTLTLGGTGNYVFNGTITDNPLLTVAAPNNVVSLTANFGTAGASQTLAGANTYTGNTTVNAGTLTIDTTGSLSTLTNLTANAALVFNNAAQTVNSLNGSAAGSLVLNGTALTVNNTGTFNGSWNNGTSPASITVAGGTMTFNGPLSSTGALNANSATVIGGNTGATVLTRSLAALNIASGVAVTVGTSAFPATPLVLQPTTLTFASSTATLNLTNNELIVNEDLATAVGRIVSGQITSTPAVLGTGLGSLALSPTQTRIRYTLLGDTDLDGTVGVGDLGNLATNYGATSGAIWANGDSNYDGMVDVGDLGSLATSYGNSLAAGPSAGGDELNASALASVATVGGGSAAVPEPTTLSLLGIGAMGLLARRRRTAR